VTRRHVYLIIKRKPHNRDVGAYRISFIVGERVGGGRAT
jgi:hypothetical protein